MKRSKLWITKRQTPQPMQILRRTAACLHVHTHNYHMLFCASLYSWSNLYNRCHISKTTNQTNLHFPGLSSASTAVGLSLLSGEFLINMINKMAASTP